MINLENDKLRIGVNHKGAELCSILSSTNQREYIWQADPKFWGRHSCILFPVIGQMIYDRIRINGMEYNMPKHGLLRDKIFEIKSQTKGELHMKVQSDSMSLKSFPFEFIVQVIYTLKEKILKITYVVKNLDDKIMPFNIGAHPAFNCPMEAEHLRSDYLLLFEQKETQSSPIISNDGYLSDDFQEVMNNEREIAIREDLFDHDALILEKVRSQNVVLMHNSGKKYLNFEFGDFDQLGIWSANRQSPFVCIEPWLGTADTFAFAGEFQSKRSIQILQAGEEFSCSHSITILES